MSEQGESERASERVLCPNCPADYPTPFSSRQITCRRCGAEFVAPDDARAPWTATAADWSTTTDGHSAETTSELLRSVVVDQFPSIALGLNTLIVLLWACEIVSFEVAVMTVLLVTSAIVSEPR